jgi:CRP/FNR family cyclic AMP-dependent transcriptional regulator
MRWRSGLVDQLFNSSEKRLARVLLMLAHFGKEGIPESVIPKLSQETLNADMDGSHNGSGWSDFWSCRGQSGS